MRVVARCLAALSLVAGVLAAAPIAQAAGNTVTVTDGGAPGWIRFDDSGNGVDAHDGEIKQFGGIYYLYGTAYGCGFLRMHGYAGDGRPVTPFCGFVAYQSTDLRHWKYDGPLFDPSTTSPTDWQQICNSATLSCYRPHVLYDFATGYYRLWVNTYDGIAGYHVLKSKSPTGPFVEDADTAGHAVRPKLAFSGGGDFDLYQDSNRAGYIVYTVRSDPLGPDYAYKLVIEALSRDYTTGTGSYTTLDTRHTEAPSMFRRGSNYYITMADPYCAYCAGTGTAYLRATSPLGPWRGAGSNVAMSTGQMYVDSRPGLFTGATSDVQLQLRWLWNYDFAFRARPVPSLTDGRTTRVGWMFRAADAGDGYNWIITNRPRGKAPATLIHNIFRNGKVVKSWSTPVATPLLSTTQNVIRTRAVNAKIQTWLNGKLVDTVKNKTYKNGFAGVRETPGFSAYYDDFSVSRPPALHYRLWIADHFNSGSMANFPMFNTFRRRGVRISDDSCGGQPTDVAMLRAPNAAGSEYLYQSDRWDNGDQNEAQAMQYWQPLAFNPDGSIAALSCGQIYTATLSDATASDPVGAADFGSDKTAPGPDGFQMVQDITGTRARGQSFQVTSTGNLTQVVLTLFQTDDDNGSGPNADLTVSLYDVGSPNGTPNGVFITQATVPRSQISWSPRTVTVPLTAPLATHPDGQAGQYAIVISTTSTTGAYGTARFADDTNYDADPTGYGLVRSGDAEAPAWVTETNDLRYALTVTAST